MARNSAARRLELTRGEAVIAFCHKYLKVPEGAHVGRDVALRDWQREMLLDIYDQRTRRAIISFGRKNGKTALVAMLILSHLVGPVARRNSQIYSAAQSRDQAAIVFNLAAKMVRMSPELNELVTVRESRKELYCGLTGVTYRALSADATTAYGLSPSLVIHDELGQVRGPRSELYDALESAMGAQTDRLSIIISTQAPNNGDLLSQLIDDAQRGQDAYTRVYLYSAPDQADPWTEETWRLANPALGDFRSLSDVEEIAATAKRLPVHEASFRNLILNQRISVEDHFLTPAIWKLNSGPVDPAVFTGPVWIGVDLSSTQDLTAIVAVAKDHLGNWHIRPWFFLPSEGLSERSRQDRVPYDHWVAKCLLTVTPGRSVDYDWVAEMMAPVLRGMNVQTVAYDRYQFEHFQKALARKGYEPTFLTDVGQGTKTMTPALRIFEVLALEGKLRHGDNPILTWNATNARTVIGRDANDRKLTKGKSIGRIDGIVALTMALWAANKDAAPPPTYQAFFA